MELKLLDSGRGFGGSTCARYLQRFNNNIDITLVEASVRYISCPFSNTVISGMQQMDSITHDYSAHKNRGIKVVHAMAKEWNNRVYFRLSKILCGFNLGSAVEHRFSAVPQASGQGAACS